MSDPGFEVTFEEVQRYDWQSVTAPLEQRDLHHDRASTSFFQKAAALREAQDEVGERVFRFLAAVMSLLPNFESTDTPFRSVPIEVTRRSTTLDDFTPADAATLAQLVPITIDPELKSRLADVATVLKFDHALVREASAAYLTLAQRRENCEEWPRFIPDIERAAQLAWKLGGKSQPFFDVMLHVESLIEKFSPTDAGLCCWRLLELLSPDGPSVPPKVEIECTTPPQPFLSNTPV